MTKYQIISCMGCEKKMGKITTACSLLLENKQEAMNITFKPSLAQIAANKIDLTNEDQVLNIIAINGCMSQCVNEILSLNELKPIFAINMPKIMKKFKILKEIKNTPEILNSPEINEISSEIENVLKEFFEKFEKSEASSSDVDFKPEYKDFLEFIYTKFHFQVPKSDENLFFNWNDAWAYHIGNGKVVVGITDYLQKNMSDIIFCEFMEIGQEIGLFEAVATLESSKTVNEVLTPFSGKIIQVNENLVSAPELINEDPYRKGWIAVVETSNFSDEKADLMESNQYFELMKEKIEEEGGH